MAPSVGRFESDFFDPVKWRPEYPNPAFDNMRPDDAFWGARLVANFTDERIRAIVAKARYSDPAASEYIAKTLIARRDKVLKAWLTGVNPVVSPALSADGVLTFRNAAVEAGMASPASAYVLAWSAFDNATGSAIGPAQETRVDSPRAPAPPSILQGHDFISVVVRTVHTDYPSWNVPVTMVFRRTPQGWQPVGLEREIR